MKRFVDIVIVVPALILLFPVMAVVACLVACCIGRPVVFRQPRPGLDGKVFTIYKFRTMTDATASNGEVLPDDQRLVPVGEFLRKTSLDELPELFNIIRGDMAMVGPRPLLMEYLPLYTRRQYRRHELRPGLTGWAQINGRNALSWDAKFELDVWYVENQTFWLDMKILFLTLFKVIKRDDIGHGGAATMPRFTGSEGSQKNRS